MMAKLEIACFDNPSALIAAEAGADRIELCRDYASGGLSPDPFALARIRPRIKQPIYVMLRENDHFNITKAGLHLLKHQLFALKTANADGFVFGFLTASSALEESSNRLLLELADGLPCTLHRAFDVCEAKEQAIETAIQWGFTSILSAGGAANAQAGIQQLNQWQLAYPELSFIAGGGIRSANLPVILEKGQLNWYHSAAILAGSQPADPAEVTSLKLLLG
jgi:copper homeostasis protein